MKHKPSSGKHERLESPKFEIPDRHSQGGKGDRPDGTKVHGTKYKQPWVEHDPVVENDPTVG